MKIRLYLTAVIFKKDVDNIHVYMHRDEEFKDSINRDIEYDGEHVYVTYDIKNKRYSGRLSVFKTLGEVKELKKDGWTIDTTLPSNFKIEFDNDI